MIRAYSQRLLPPYTGYVQIAETDRARAQSFDGLNWEIQYLSGNEQDNHRQNREQGYGLDRGFFKVGHLQDGELTTFIFPACVDAATVEGCINQLSEFLSTAQIPFPAADNYEYWLLDGSDQSPLALLFSCCAESLMDTYPAHTVWTALPHSKVDIDNTEGEDARREPPVNQRFQDMVARRAGSTPRAAWFKRSDDEADDFPCFMVREDWENVVERDLCQRYMQRLAPRLLMLQGVPHDDRERMEVAAKQYALEVEQYYPFYPKINDDSRMSAILVEARLRRGMPQAPKAKKKDKTIAPLSKDMRILE